jgi:hypothetical protein
VKHLAKNLLAIPVIVIVIVVIVMIETVRQLRPPLLARACLGLAIAGLVMLALALTIHFAKAHDSGQWDETDLVTRHWYKHLMQPDNPAMSCCGEADAYWCDILKTEAVDGKVKNYCIVTDDRPDEPRRRPHIDVGTEIEIPDYKMKWDRGNPTGHGIVFVSRGLYVYCFVMPGGV